MQGRGVHGAGAAGHGRHGVGPVRPLPGPRVQVRGTLLVAPRPYLVCMGTQRSMCWILSVRVCVFVFVFCPWALQRVCTRAPFVSGFVASVIQAVSPDRMLR